MSLRRRQDFQLIYLFEMVAQFNDGRSFKHPVLIDDQLAMTERINVTLDQEEIGAALHRKEALARHVDAMSILEMLDSSTGSSFELDNGVTIIGGLRVDDDVKLHALNLHDSLKG